MSARWRRGFSPNLPRATWSRLNLGGFSLLSIFFCELQRHNSAKSPLATESTYIATRILVALRRRTSGGGANQWQHLVVTQWRAATRG